MSEQTGLEAVIGRPVCWAEWIWQRSHCAELMFLEEVMGAQLAAGNDPELAGDQQIVFNARIFDPDDLDQYPVYPAELVTLIRNHLDRGFPEPDLPR